MAQSATLYEAGFTETQQFVVSLNTSAMEEQKARLVTRFIEFWCQKNCRGRWRVEERSQQIVVSFKSERDTVMFKMSAEYYEFEGQWGRVQGSIMGFLRTIPVLTFV